MHQFRRIILIVLGTFVSVAAVILLSVNLYVQSQGTQTRIQQELSHRLGLPLNIRRISVTPWGGLKLSGIVIPQTPSRESVNFLEARTFRLRIRLSSLFSHRLVIKEVLLVDPHVIWLQNAEGKWWLPGLAQREGPFPPGTEVQAADSAVPSREPEQIPPAPASPPAAVRIRPDRETRDENEPVRFVPQIRRIRVTGGNFRFLDESGNFVAAFEGLRFRSDVRDAVSLLGNAQVAKISLRDRFFLEGMRSNLRYDPSKLTLSEMSAHAGAGDLSGRFTMEPQAEDSPFSLAIKFRNVQADRIITEAGGSKGVVQGKLEGTFEATGKIADSNALQGRGEIYLHDGQVQQYSVLVALGQILQIEELKQLHLDQAQAKYHINSGVVTVDELMLRSPNVRLSAKGSIAFDGKLRLDSQLAINDKIRNQLFKPIRANFQPASEPGYFAVDFEVGGTIDRPKSNLVEKVVGRDLKDFGSVINSFLGGGKTDRPKKKRSVPETAEPKATATPAPSP